MQLRSHQLAVSSAARVRLLFPFPSTLQQASKILSIVSLDAAQGLHLILIACYVDRLHAVLTV